MISDEQKQVILHLYHEGKGKKRIARELRLNIKSVRRAISESGSAKLPRRNSKDIDIGLLKTLYDSCDGYIQRIYEKLNEEHGCNIGYSTLSRLLRAKGIGVEVKPRSPHLEVYPGIEMQHDTSPFWVLVAGKKVKAIASGLYLRYSKMRYVKFYPCFNRFMMKCFLHEALMFWGHSAGTCIIDNTNLAVHSGSGSRAVFNEEMELFSRKHGYRWKAHEIGCPNRKAGKERNFYTLETNFFPGRSFVSWADLNKQVFEWATVRYAQRPHSQTKLIPIQLFEEEKKHMTALPGWMEAPYESYERVIDEYGYVAYEGNYYWVPQTEIKEIKIIRYEQKIKIFTSLKEYKEYTLPEPGTHNQEFGKENAPPFHPQPKSMKKSCDIEEEKLRAMGPAVTTYLDWLINSKVRTKSKLIRELYLLSQKISVSLFTEVLENALLYQVTSLEVLRDSAVQKLHLCVLPPVENLNYGDYTDREAYQEGRFSQERQMDFYSELTEPSERNMEHGRTTQDATENAQSDVSSQSLE
jgi:hypothetical protein